MSMANYTQYSQKVWQFGPFWSPMSTLTDLTHTQETHHHHWPICLVPGAAAYPQRSNLFRYTCIGLKMDASELESVWTSLNFQKNIFGWLHCHIVHKSIQCSIENVSFMTCISVQQRAARVNAPVMDTVTLLTRSGDGSWDESLLAPEGLFSLLLLHTDLKIIHHWKSVKFDIFIYLKMFVIFFPFFSTNFIFASAFQSLCLLTFLFSCGLLQKVQR